ncbi:uncharacterized protein LOC141902292 isoform X2 [Tubulanus polymorphus]|uniref:uncharacterized protein LOC141902292 isoform X2 n=1 Tax=Tubulanus polymorphus TaxID=672921 RepID=UPI003DA28873
MSWVIGFLLALLSGFIYLPVHTVIGEQQNCIDAADTTLTAVAAPADVKLGGTTVVQCQVSPTSKDFCGHRIILGDQSRQFSFDKTNCPRETINGYTGQCDVTAGRYGIRIENVQMTDAGTWSCDYMNSFQHSRTAITVVAPPSGAVLTSQPNTANNNIVTVQENSQLTITCDGSQSGATGLTYKWSGVNLSGRSNNKLSFTRISKTDSGVYICTVSNTFGSVAGNITINVQYAPTITGQVETVRVRIGETAKFTINFDANPSGGITLSCVKNETNGTTTSKRFDTNTTDGTAHSVTIQSVQASDYGNYSCQLNNSIGSAEIALQLKKADIFATQDPTMGQINSKDKASGAHTNGRLSTGGLVGGIVGAVLLIVVVIVVMVCVRKRRNDSKSSGEDDKREKRDDNDANPQALVDGADGPIYSNIDETKKKPKGPATSAAPLYAQVDPNRKRNGKKANKPQKKNYNMDESPYHMVGDDEDLNEEVHNDNGDIYSNCGINNPTLEDSSNDKDEPIYLHTLTKNEKQAPPSEFIGDFDDEPYMELGAAAPKSVTAQLDARFKAKEAERAQNAKVSTSVVI